MERNRHGICTDWSVGDTPRTTPQKCLRMCAPHNPDKRTRIIMFFLRASKESRDSHYQLQLKQDTGIQQRECQVSKLAYEHQEEEHRERQCKPPSHCCPRATRGCRLFLVTVSPLATTKRGLLCGSASAAAGAFGGVRRGLEAGRSEDRGRHDTRNWRVLTAGAAAAVLGTERTEHSTGRAGGREAWAMKSC
jgi:hypothetical protein